ncbi:MAG: hypothetical protein C0P75_002165 [Bacilli bacterium]|jgi:hypothetical protein|uniref:Uncharacterized protein n=1 Tax=Ureibacillus suwonensis TaxID=313007 RepID=A0ABW0RID1_9BACL|nr:hypothetical protein [Bacilli bacterium]
MAKGVFQLILQIIGGKNFIGFILFFVLYIFSMIFGFFKHSLFFAFSVIGLIGAVIFIVRIVSNLLKEIRRRNTE